MRPRAAPRLVDDLSWLDVGSRYSRVRKLAYPVDPMRRFCDGPPLEPPAGAGTLRDAVALVEWAYGFRAHPVTRGRVTRRSPSAGALYPTEVMLLAHHEGRWQLHYYDCRRHALFPVRAARADTLAERLDATTGDVVVLLASVLWRSAQRYGARCYLYCLLDAGHVAANLIWAAREFGRDVVPLAAPACEPALALRGDEALVLALRVGAGAVPVAPAPADVEVSPPGPSVLEPPPVSPLLRRTAGLHGRATGADCLPLALDWLPSPRRDGDMAAAADRRRSAAAFEPTAAGADVHASVLDHVRALLARRSAASASPLTAHVVTMRVRRRSPDGAATALQAACQDQPVVGQSAFAIALVAPLAQLERGGHGSLRRLALEAGAVSAELYRHATAVGIGTTAIGGFSGMRLARVLGRPDAWPLTVQVFGVEAAEPLKADAAVVPGAQRAA